MAKAKSSKSRSKSGAVKRFERRQRFNGERAAWVAEHPTPYEGWADDADALRSEVNRAMEATPNAYAYHPNASAVCSLSVNDLSATLFAVERAGRKGLSIGQVLKCYERCGVGKSRAKAVAALKALIDLGIIRHTAYYLAGVRGNVYERGKQTQPPTRKGPPPTLPTPPTAPAHADGEDDDAPF